MRILLGLCVALLLGACNRVHTDHPLFFAEDARGAPLLRNGLWVVEDSLGAVADDEPCRFDARKPVTRWPDCAEWMLVRDGELLGYDREKGGQGSWTSVPFVLAKGEPAVLQIGVTGDDGPTTYSYFGLQPIRSDAGGVVAFHSWPVLCGPPPPPAKKDEKPRFVTLEPLPGLTVVEDNCTADAAGPVRAAAAASRAWTDDAVGGARWIRDTYP